jgi:hypothetical protein
MSDVYLEALQNYLNGREWRESIEMFVSANCSLYADIQDMNHKQYEMWRTFQEIVENILEMALQTVGGSTVSLEKELTRIMKYKEPKGPRDEKIKDVLERLLSFEDFKDFAEMMNREYQVHCEEFINNDEVHPVNEEHYQTLIQMGYEEEDIDITMQSLPINTSLEVLINEISCRVEASRGDSPQRNGPSSSSSSARHNGRSDVDYEYNAADFDAPARATNRDYRQNVRTVCSLVSLLSYMLNFRSSRATWTKSRSGPQSSWSTTLTRSTPPSLLMRTMSTRNCGRPCPPR